MADLIDRQAALDAITDELMPSTPLSAVIRAKNRLKDLPAVQPDHVADVSKKVSISCGQENDLISRRVAIKALDEWFKKAKHPLNGSEYNQGEIDAYVTAIDTIKTLAHIQPEIIRCKDCKYMIDTGDDLMCDNTKGWVVATTSDFGCVLAERRTE